MKRPNEVSSSGASKREITSTKSEIFDHVYLDIRHKVCDRPSTSSEIVKNGSPDGKSSRFPEVELSMNSQTMFLSSMNVDVVILTPKKIKLFCGLRQPATTSAVSYILSSLVLSIGTVEPPFNT